MNKQIVVLRESFRVLNTVAPKASAKLAEKVFLSIPKPKLLAKEKTFLQTSRKYNVPFKGTYMVSYEWGNKEDPAVMLVHGWTSNAAAYIDLVPKLLKQKYRVIAYDMISHGYSPKSDAQITCWADALRAVLSYHGKVEAIIGHSLGGAGILIASKLGLPTKKLVLISPCSDMLEISDRFAEMLNIPERIIQMKRENIWSKYEAAVERYGSDWRDIFNSKFKVPTLIFHDLGDEDITPENSVRVKLKWHWAQLQYTENLGHQQILHDDLTLDRIVAFVSGSKTWRDSGYDSNRINTTRRDQSSVSNVMH